MHKIRHAEETHMNINIVECGFVWKMIDSQQTNRQQQKITANRHKHSSTYVEIERVTYEFA